MGKETGIYK